MTVFSDFDIIVVTLVAYFLYLLRDLANRRGNGKIFDISMMMLTIVVILTMFHLLLKEEQIPIRQFVTLLIVWGVCVFAFCTQLLFLGLIERLNRGRPDGRWIREIEYPYLLLGLIGLFLTINNSKAYGGAVVGVRDAVGPIIIVAATALKFLKTRAETAGWAGMK